MKTMAVHLHLYYTEQLTEILSYLQNLKDITYDLYVSLTQENEEIRQQILDFNPKTKIFITANRGYDIGSFIDFLHHIDLNAYKYILKLHTKGKKSKNYTHLNNLRFDNALWGKVLWDGLVSSPERVQKNIELLQQKEVGMIGSKYCLTDHPRDYQNLLPFINNELTKMHLKEVEKVSFIAGSMFMIKSDLLEPFLRYRLEDFSLTDGTIKEGTLAHIMERLFGTVVIIKGYKICGTYGIMRWYPRLVELKISLLRFLYQKKITKSGKLLIKICKLPIYSKEI